MEFSIHHLIVLKIFKGYLCYNTIFCHKVALDMQFMNLFIWRKNNASFLRYLDFCFSQIHRFHNFWRHIGIATLRKLQLWLFLLNSIKSTIKTKFGQILVYCMKNISNMFLAQCRRLKTSSRPFYDFFKTKISKYGHL